MELVPGAVFAGHRIEQVAGRGGMGVVYKATHLALEITVALKVIAPEMAEDEDFRARFKRESRLAARVEHPHLIPVRHAGEEEGRLYVTMRYIEGTDLRRMIAEEDELAPELVAEIIDQVAAGLGAAHAAGLVHRDVKPANILVERGSSGVCAYLTDFGLTRRQAGTERLTKTGQAMGTIDYVAPEQIQGEEVDARADVYSLGCVLYHALCGQVPYPRESEVAKIYAHLSEPRPSVTAYRPDLPPSVDPVIGNAMAIKRDERYASAAELAGAFREVIGPATPTAAPETLPPAAPVTEPAAAPETEPRAAPKTEAAAAPPTEPAPAAPTAPAARAPATEAATTRATPSSPPPGSPRRPTERRRRLGPLLAAAGGLAALAAAIALLAGGGGGDGGGENVAASDETAGERTTADEGGGGGDAAALAAFNADANAICTGIERNVEQASAAGLSPAEFLADRAQIVEDGVAQLRRLDPPTPALERQLDRYADTRQRFATLLRELQAALESGDTAAREEIQARIDATVKEKMELGERMSLDACADVLPATDQRQVRDLASRWLTGADPQRICTQEVTTTFLEANFGGDRAACAAASPVAPDASFAEQFGVEGVHATSTFRSSSGTILVDTDFEDGRWKIDGVKSG